MPTIIARKSVKPKSKETEALKKISSMVNRSLELNAILISTLDEMMATLGMDAGVFRLRATPEAFSKTIFRGFAKEVAAVFEDAGNEAAGKQSAIALISGNESTWGTGPLPDALRNAGMQFFVTYPIRSGNRLLGHMGLASKRPYELTEAQQGFLFALCEILGVAIMNVSASRSGEQALRRSHRTPGVEQDHLPELPPRGYYSKNCDRGEASRENQPMPSFSSR